MEIYLKHPVHGEKVAYSEAEANEDKKHGWEIIDNNQSLDLSDDMGFDDASALYEQKFGEKPHHRMKLETIMAKVNDNSQ